MKVVAAAVDTSIGGGWFSSALILLMTFDILFPGVRLGFSLLEDEVVMTMLKLGAGIRSG